MLTKWTELHAIAVHGQTLELTLLCDYNQSRFNSPFNSNPLPLIGELVLAISRKLGEKIMVGDDIVVEVLSISRNIAQLRITSAHNLKIDASTNVEQLVSRSKQPVRIEESNK